MQKINDFGEWLLKYITPKPKVVDKVLEFFKNKNKKGRKDGYFVPTNAVQISFENLCDSVSNGYYPEAAYYKPYDQHTTN